MIQFNTMHTWGIYNSTRLLSFMNHVSQRHAVCRQYASIPDNMKSPKLEHISMHVTLSQLSFINSSDNEKPEIIASVGVIFSLLVCPGYTTTV